MELQDRLFDLLMYTLPALIVFLTSFTMLKKFFEQEQKNRMIDAKQDFTKNMLPARLQSFERLILFLERIAPENLLIRVHKQGMSAKVFHTSLIDSIQQEYEHNLSQQVYVSNNSWEKVKHAKDETIRIVNLGMKNLKEDSTGLDLSQQIFQILTHVGKSPSIPAIAELKKEARKYF